MLPGQLVGVVGPNGCGKSSFIKLITRELYPLARTEGGPPVQVLGQARWQVDRLRAQLGIVTGDFGATLADMHALTAEDAVLSGLFASFVLPPFREITEDMRTRAAEALERAHALPLRRRKDSRAVDPSVQVVVKARDRMEVVKLEATKAPVAPVAVDAEAEKK